MSNVNKTYVTYLVNDLFLPGVATLAASLEFNKCKYPLHCLVTPYVSKIGIDFLQSLNCKTVELSYQDLISPNRSRFEGRYKDNAWMMFTKLNIFRMTQYSKVVYLDADTIALDNPDEMFDFLPPAAYYDWHAINPLNKGLNGGVLVIEPCTRTFDELVARVDSLEYGPNTDQSLMNYYFSSFTKLDPKYNCLYKSARKSGMLKELRRNNVKILHFNGQKPWLKYRHKLGWKKSVFDIGCRHYRKYENLWYKKERKQLLTSSNHVKDFVFGRPVLNIFRYLSAGIF